MSLLEYDIINNTIDKSKSWIDISKQIIYSREILHRYRYYNFATKYDKSTNSYSYYLIHSINNINNNSKVMQFDNYGRAKIKVNTIFKELGFDCKSKNHNITLKLKEENKDYDIYLIEDL